ncbi:MAG: alpha/beta hydrolase [Verrucomicrobiota bacterium]|nr:alpha/beta hydrolase [Verrucomicrobiota bacterium]
MNRRRFVALAGVIFYGAVVSCAPVLDRLALFPSTYQIDAAGATRALIPFEDGELEIWAARSPAAKKTGRAEIFVLRFYGNADRAEHWVASEAEMFGGRAVEVWGVNYPGFGGSTGPARLARIGPPSLAAYDALKKHAGDRPIYVFGASMGTTAALHISAQRQIAGVILHNPPALRQMILRQFGWWNLWLLAGPLSQKVPAALDNIANAKASHAPAIFLLAENDEVVAPKFQSLVVQAYAGAKRVISLPGATHNSPITGQAGKDFRAGVDWLFAQ